MIVLSVIRDGDESSKMKNLKDKLRSLIDFQIKIYYPNAIDKIDTYAEISRKLGFDSRSRLIKELLIEYLGKKKFNEIFTERWKAVATIKKQRLYRFLDYQFNKYFPDNIDEIFSIGILARLLKKGRNQVRKLVGNYLLDKFKDINIALELKNSIWLKKSTTEHKMNYEIVKTFTSNLGYELVTTQQEFNNLKEIPSMRIINIKCNEGHIWPIRTSVLLYLGTECPTCSERYKCQTIMRLFMEKIFGVPFPLASLSKVYGVSGERIVRIKENSYKIQIGMLSFDGYNPKVLVNGKYFKIAFEYDGRHHDEKNHYYYTRYGRDFYFVKASDTIKFNLANNERTIVIRLKEINGFKLSTIDTFQNEIIRQFQEFSGEVLTNIPKYRYDVKSKSIMFNNNSLNNY